MESPAIHIINTTKAEAQAVLNSTRELANRPDVRIIIVVCPDDDDDGVREGRQINALPSFASYAPLLSHFLGAI